MGGSYPVGETPGPPQQLGKLTYMGNLQPHGVLCRGAQRAGLHPGSAQPGSRHAPAQTAKQRLTPGELEKLINQDLETKLA